MQGILVPSNSGETVPVPPSSYEQIVLAWSLKDRFPLSVNLFYQNNHNRGVTIHYSVECNQASLILFSACRPERWHGETLFSSISFTRGDRPIWDIWILVIISGILPLWNWDIHEEFGILGCWPWVNWDIGPLKMGYWDMDHLKLGCWFFETGIFGIPGPPLTHPYLPWRKIISSAATWTTPPDCLFCIRF